VPTRNKNSVFISHSSADLAIARKIQAKLEAGGFGVWLDSSDIHLGALLRSELHGALEKSRAVVLLWSKPASKSRWVAAEILTSFHMDRFIVPCVVDETPLPQFLGSSVHLDLRRGENGALNHLVSAVGEAPAHANPIPPLMAAATVQLDGTIGMLSTAQQHVTSALLRGDIDQADQMQRKIDPAMKQAERAWKYERMIHVLGGYHRKNAYMVKHWAAMQAGVEVQDPLLEKAERCFFEALFVDPLEVSAINGLGSILILERELDAAEFFVRRAIALSEREGIDYSAARHDLEIILRFKGRNHSGHPESRLKTTSSPKPPDGRRQRRAGAGR
jgi:tetratricopeptide (TPR) repeat protein